MYFKQFILIFSLLLISADCSKSSSSCHKEISLYNTSANDVIFAFRYTDTEGNCNLSGVTTNPDEIYQDKINECWENRLKLKVYEFYVVDPIKFNSVNLFYDCDSIEMKNKILKKFILTIDELKNMDFKVVYN